MYLSHIAIQIEGIKQGTITPIDSYMPMPL